MNLRKLHAVIVMACLGLPLVSGCFDDDADEVYTGPSSAELAKAALAELKDEPFDPTGWETNENPPLYGSPHAKPGGLLKVDTLEYPATLCPIGPNARSEIIRRMNLLVIESLLSYDDRTEKFSPGLATHWKIDDGGKTFWFRINPKARWADGREVTALDIVESYKLLIDKRTKSPWHNDHWARHHHCPEAISKYVVKVRNKDVGWKNFLLFAASMYIFPAHQIMSEHVHSKFYRIFNWKMYAGSGPYKLEYTTRGRAVTFIKREDWWAKDLPQNKGLYNFKRIKFIVIKDDTLIFEKFKKGELDVYACNISKRWAKECDFDKIKKGWIQKRQIWNEKAVGVQGFAMNTREWPFNDMLVRKAMCYLYPRKKLIDKLFYGQYLPLDSHYEASAYKSPLNIPIRFDPVKGKELLAQAGYSKRNSEGILVDSNDRPLELTLQYSQKSSERYYTVYKEALAEAGVKLNLKLATRTSTFKMMLEHNFKITGINWTAPRPPAPRGSLHSDNASKKNTSNVCGVAIPELDKLIEQYENEPDPDIRVRLMQQIDHIAYSNHHYVLDWYCPFVRVLYWNKFSYPEFQYSITGYHYWPVFQYWWIDNDKDKELKAAVAKDTNLEQGELDNQFWLEYRKTNGRNWRELQEKLWSANLENSN